MNYRKLLWKMYLIPVDLVRIWFQEPNPQEPNPQCGPCLLDYNSYRQPNWRRYLDTPS